MTDTSGPMPGDAPTPWAERGGPHEWYRSCGPPGGLRWLAEDFAAGFSAAASSLLRAEVRSHLTAAAETLRSQFARALDELTCSYVIAAPPPAAGEAPIGVGLEFSPAIAFAAIEHLLGAPAARAPVPDRPLTAAERRVLLRLADAAALALAGAWPATPAAKPRLSAQLRPLPLAAGDEPALVATFELGVDDRTGTLRICLPRGLAAAGGPRQPPRLGRTPLELTAWLEGVLVAEDEAANLAAGDIVATEIAADGEIIVRIGGIPKFAARLDTAGGRSALTITRRLDGPSPPDPQRPAPC